MTRGAGQRAAGRSYIAPRCMCRADTRATCHDPSGLRDRTTVALARCSRVAGFHRRTVRLWDPASNAGTLRLSDGAQVGDRWVLAEPLDPCLGTR